MREILFKGKRVDNGEWVYGSLLLIEERSYIVYDAEMSCIDGENTDLYATEWYEVVPSTICQYTGLVDRNGKQIFEGDIVKHYNNDSDPFQFDIGTIMWNDKVCQFQRKSNSDNRFYDINNICVYEVIGNIFDNPGLMEGAKGIEKESINKRQEKI